MLRPRTGHPSKARPSRVALGKVSIDGKPFRPVQLLATLLCISLSDIDRPSVRNNSEISCIGEVSSCLQVLCSRPVPTFVLPLLFRIHLPEVIVSYQGCLDIVYQHTVLRQSHDTDELTAILDI